MPPTARIQWFKDAKSDFLSLLNIWKFFVDLREEGGHKRQVQACREKFLNWLRLREWRDLHGQLAQTLRELNWNTDGELAKRPLRRLPSRPATRLARQYRRQERRR